MWSLFLHFVLQLWVVVLFFCKRITAAHKQIKWTKCLTHFVQQVVCGRQFFLPIPAGKKIFLSTDTPKTELHPGEKRTHLVERPICDIWVFVSSCSRRKWKCVYAELQHPSYIVPKKREKTWGVQQQIQIRTVWYIFFSPNTTTVAAYNHSVTGEQRFCFTMYKQARRQAWIWS